MTQLKTVVSRFIRNLMLDIPPSTAAEIVDFGFNNAHDEVRLYEVYQRAVKQEIVSVDEMNEAVGDGPMLTALLHRIDKSIVVKTDWDVLSD
jgi:hypothetical protein